jgi:hypothetical protein
MYRLKSRHYLRQSIPSTTQKPNILPWATAIGTLETGSLASQPAKLKEKPLQTSWQITRENNLHIAKPDIGEIYAVVSMVEHPACASPSPSLPKHHTFSNITTSFC